MYRSRAATHQSVEVLNSFVIGSSEIGEIPKLLENIYIVT